MKSLVYCSPPQRWSVCLVSSNVEWENVFGFSRSNRTLMVEEASERDVDFTSVHAYVCVVLLPHGMVSEPAPVNQLQWIWSLTLWICAPSTYFHQLLFTNFRGVVYAYSFRVDNLFAEWTKCHVVYMWFCSAIWLVPSAPGAKSQQLFSWMLPGSPLPPFLRRERGNEATMGVFNLMLVVRMFMTFLAVTGVWQWRRLMNEM